MSTLRHDRTLRVAESFPRAHKFELLNNEVISALPGLPRKPNHWSSDRTAAPVFGGVAIVNGHRITIQLEKYRKNPADREWELPPWGHPISLGVLPLFLAIDEHLIPVGTAFTTGNKVTFIVSATHNIREAIKEEPRLEHLAGSPIEGTLDLKHVSLSVLHQHTDETGRTRLSLWPIETFRGPSPTDVVIGSPQFAAGLVTPVHPLSFNMPPVGEKLWSVGYSEFEFPNGGIPRSAILDGSFDWQNNYGHRLFVVEGRVERIFAQKFAAGYIEGPCFAFDAEIRHGMSGGPLFSPSGVVRGVNSAGASQFFGEPKSLGSLLHPILSIRLKFGAQLGPLRINADHRVIDLVAHGTLVTDGSETDIGFTEDAETGSLITHLRFRPDDRSFVHDDFQSFQGGKAPTISNDVIHVLRRTDESSKD